jgi:MATE family multidrug resistance protein
VSSVTREVRLLALLATPVALTQLSAMLLWTVDLLMVGRIGVVELNAVSLGRLLIVATATPGLGLVFGLDPIAAQAHGARDRARLGDALLHGIALALVASAAIGVVWFYAGEILLAFGQDPATVALAARYVRVQIPALPAYFVFMVLRQVLQARGIVRPAMWISFGANLFNSLLNYALIFGRWGAPRLEAVGAGVATAVTQAAMLVALVAAMRLYRLQRGTTTVLDPRALRSRAFVELAGLGAPVAAQLALEYWAFAIATLWAGRLGAVELAAHSIALNLASISYMVPLGIASGAATRVGQRIGAGDKAGAERAAWVALGSGAAVMLAFAALFVAGRSLIPSWYGVAPEVVALAAALLPIVAAFELFDGVQCVGGGVLRGMGSTRTAAGANLVGYYALGLPLGWTLGRPERLGLAGIWWGLALGLFVVAAALAIAVALRGPRRARALVERTRGRVSG